MGESFGITECAFDLILFDIIIEARYQEGINPNPRNLNLKGNHSGL